MPRRTAPIVACLSVLALGLGACRTGSTGAQNDTRSVLSVFAQPTPRDAAMMAVDEFNPDNRRRGLSMLANAQFGGEDVYIELYEAALRDGDPAVRGVAVRALGTHGGPRHVGLIVEQLEDPSPLLRWEAATALQRLHEPRAAIPALLGAADDRREPDADVRAAAVTAMGQYADRRVLDGLIGALDDPSLLVNHAARGSLWVLTGQDFGDRVPEWIEWLAAAEDPFEGRGPYRYPVFTRDRRFVEWIIPFMEPPNEVSAAPAGMSFSDSDPSAEAGAGDVRNN